MSEEKESGARRYNYTNEQLILLASSVLSLELSQGRTPNEIELLALILQNVATQLATIADMRVLGDDIDSEQILLILPII